MAEAEEELPHCEPRGAPCLYRASIMECSLPSGWGDWGYIHRLAPAGLALSWLFPS